MADQGLTRLAEAIADGDRIDWERESTESGSSPDDLKAFQNLEAVVVAHRGFQAEVNQLPSRSMPDDPESRDVANRGLPFDKWGTLELREFLGEGNYGSVYRAFDPVLQTEVALKVRKLRHETSDDAERRFLDEARRLAKVRHQHVVSIYGADILEGRLGFWMEFVRGETLDEILVKRGRLSAKETALIGVDLCRAVAAVHAAGLVHRDVKTSNVMREEGGRIVLLDFGTVTEEPTPGTADDHTSMAGTPLYMAPEVLRGHPATTASDVYSLGTLMYRLVSGAYPLSSKKVRAARVGGEAKHRPLRDVAPGLPSSFVAVIERAIAPLPENRYATAGGLERAIVDAIDLEPARAPWYKTWRGGVGLLSGLAMVAFSVFVMPGLRDGDPAEDLTTPVFEPPSVSTPKTGSPGTGSRPGIPRIRPPLTRLSARSQNSRWADDIERGLQARIGFDAFDDDNANIVLNLAPDEHGHDVGRIETSTGSPFGDGAYNPTHLRTVINGTHDAQTFILNVERIFQNEEVLNIARAHQDSMPAVTVELVRLTARTGDEPRHELTCIAPKPSAGVCSQCYVRTSAVTGRPEDDVTALATGDLVAFVVHNREPDPVYVYVVDLQPTGGMETLRPREGHPDAFYIPPGDSLSLDAAARSLTDSGLIDSYLCFLVDAPFQNWALDLSALVPFDESGEPPASLRGGEDRSVWVDVLESMDDVTLRGSAPQDGPTRMGARIFSIQVQP